MPTIPNAPSGEDTASDGTEKIPVSASKYMLVSTIAEYIRTLAQVLTNKTLTTPQINDTSSDHQYVFAGSELTADRTITLPLLTGNDVFVFADFIQTLTNKRITRRSVTTTQSATPTINTDNGDIFTITGLAQAITSLTTNLSGTPTNGQMMLIQITDNGTARAITPGASFAGTTTHAITALTTVLGKELKLLWMYSSALSKWELVGNTSSL